MGVCHIVSSFRPNVGGAERATERLCKELLLCGFDTIVLTRPYAGLRGSGSVSEIPLYRPGIPSRNKMGALLFSLHALWLLATRLRRYRVIHVQNIDAPLLIGLVCKLLLGRSLVATIHGEAKIAQKRQTKRGRARLALMRRLVDRFVAISQPMQEELLKLGVSNARIRLIPNGVDMAVFRPPTATEKRQARARLNLPDSAVVSLYLGRLSTLKRVDLLLRAWRRLPSSENNKLVVVGDGAERQGLARLASELNLRGVRFDGHTDDALSHLHAADIFVLPSEQEGLSVALIEAMATGLCCVVTALPGNRALVNHGETGLVFPVKSTVALVSCLSEALASPEERARLGRNARRHVFAACSLGLTGRLHRALYEDLLAEQSDANGKNRLELG